VDVRGVRVFFTARLMGQVDGGEIVFSEDFLHQVTGMDEVQGTLLNSRELSPAFYAKRRLATLKGFTEETPFYLVWFPGTPRNLPNRRHTQSPPPSAPLTTLLRCNTH
jgi:hypothetical protein